MKVLITSSIEAKPGGGVANVEYLVKQGLVERGYGVGSYFPYKFSMFLSDLVYGFNLGDFKKDYDVIHTHTNIGWATSGAFRTFHGCTAKGEAVANTEGDRVLKRGLYFTINKFMEKICAQKNHCIAVSNYTADAISEYYDVPRDKIYVVHNGVDTDKFYPCKTCRWEMREELGIPKDAFVVAWIGGFEFNKGIYYLKQVIDRCEKNENIYFIVRNSTGADIPEEYAWLRNTPRVIYMKHGHDMSEFYNTADLFLCTATYDPMPLSILEAMSCGIPAIVPNSGGYIEVVIDKESGFIIQDYHNTIEMANWIKVMANSPNWCKRLGRAARKRILNKFTIKHMINNYISAYKYFTRIE